MQSLPLLPPVDDSTPWLQSVFRPRSESPPPHASSEAAHAQLTQQQQRQHRQQRDEEKRLHATRSPLTLLAADEAAISQRKAAIRNFGAYWIRPPGIGKTLQSMIVEEVERREQEELERQERGLLDLQAQQQLQEAQQRAAETAAEEEDDAPPERDLDEDVPDAEAESTFEDASLDEENSYVEGQEQVYEDLEEAELTGVVRDEEELGIEHERNLDDSVPDAASFEGSETEAGGSSSEIEDSFAMQQARRPTQAHLVTDGSPPVRQGQVHASLFNPARRLQQSSGLPRSPGSMTLSSPQVESSFAASSPARARATRTTRAANRREH